MDKDKRTELREIYAKALLENNYAICMSMVGMIDRTTDFCLAFSDEDINILEQIYAKLSDIRQKVELISERRNNAEN